MTVTFDELNTSARLCSWVSDLSTQGKAVTTVSVHLKNVHQFLTYFRETPPPSCRLSNNQQTGLVRATKNALGQLRREVVLHQVAVKEAKVSRAISGQALNTCRAVARSRIPELLGKPTRPTVAKRVGLSRLTFSLPPPPSDTMHENTDQELRCRFYGYFAAFVASIYGHRTGVMANMTVAEVTAARDNARPDAQGYVINVSQSVAQLSTELRRLYRHVCVRPSFRR